MLKGYLDLVTAIVFLPDSKLIVLGFNNKIVRL